MPNNPLPAFIRDPIVEAAEVYLTLFKVLVPTILIVKALEMIGGIEWLGEMLSPLMRLLGIGPAAANVTVIGMVLGLSFGAGLVIRDVDSGAMSARDSYLTLCLLGLAHSLIDDTFLIMLLGANVFLCVVTRVIFAAIVVAILSRYLDTRTPLTLR